MKVIDLLNKIAKGEEVPKKVMYKNEIWEYYKDLEDYTRAGKPNTLFTMYYIHKILNNEIEIIEEDKEIEEISINENGTLGFPNGNWTARNMDKAFAYKINQLVKAVNELKKGK